LTQLVPASGSLFLHRAPSEENLKHGPRGRRESVQYRSHLSGGLHSMRKFSRKANCAALRRSNPELTRRIVPALELPSDWLSLGSFQIISQSLAKLVGRTNKFSRLRERAHWLSPARFPCGRSRYSGKWTSPDGSGQSELCVGI
jgi:hypothetical protein